MGDLTKNISRHELKCKCDDPNCKYHFVDFQTITIVQEACDHFAKKLGVDKVVLCIHSAQRCPTHNENEGGAEHSYHPLGGALDHHIKGVSVTELYDYYCHKYPRKFGIGKYTTFVHFDTRPGYPWRKQ